jgi:AraC family transcriptional regulator
MDSYFARSYNSVNGGALAYAAVSRSLSRLTHRRAAGQGNSGPCDASSSQIEILLSAQTIEISPSDSVTRRTLTWEGMAVETAIATELRRTEVRFHGQLHLLILFEEGARRDGLTGVEGLPRSGLRNYRNKLVFVPAGHEYYDWQEPSHLSRAAYFYFHPTMPPFESAMGFDQVSLPARLFFEDAGLWDIAIRLKALVDATEPADRLYGQALGVVLAHELARLGSGRTRIKPFPRGGLAGWQQRAVANYIEEHVADTIPLSALADIARLSRFHFSRAFKQTFGMPPHRFHMRRRIERAKSLLADRLATVTSVGEAVGFSETSSFSTAFRRAMGVTPSSFQRSESL